MGLLTVFALTFFLTIKDEIMKKEYRSMDVELVLGNPKIECDGYGICKFIQRGNTKLTACEKKRLMDCSIRIEKRFCLFFFNRESVESDNCAAHFKHNIFRMDTSISLPSWITDSFNLTKVRLVAGNYQVKIQDRFFQIEIPYVEDIVREKAPQYFEVERVNF
jgi:hypothetical protein